MYKLNLKKYFINISTSFILFISIIIFLFIPNNSLVSFLLLFIPILYIYKFSKNIPLLILFIFFSLYNIDACKYFIYNIKLTAWLDFQEKNYINKVLLLNSFFIYTFGLIIPNRINYYNINLNVFNKIKGKLQYYLLVILFIGILIFIKSGNNILLGGIYGESADKSPLNEYSIVLFTILLFSTPNENLIYRIISNLLFSIYIIKNLLCGNRIEIIQITIIYFYYFYVFRNKIKASTLIILIFFGIYTSTVISYIRTDPYSFIQGNYVSTLNPINIFIPNTDVEFLNSNQGDVIQSSARLVGMTDIGFINFQERVGSFIYYLISPLTISGKLPESADLSHFKQDTYKSGGGGLISIYFYVWLSYFGPIFVGLLLGLIIRFSFFTKNIYIILYSILIFISFPRLFSYNPIALIKFCLSGIIILFLLTHLFKKNNVTIKYIE